MDHFFGSAAVEISLYVPAADAVQIRNGRLTYRPWSVAAFILMPHSNEA